MSNGWIPQGTPPAAAGAPLQCAESFFLVVTVPGPREGCFPRGPSAKHQLHWAQQSQAGLGPAPLAVLAAVLVGSVSGHSSWGRAQCSVVVFHVSAVVSSTAPMGSSAAFPASQSQPCLSWQPPQFTPDLSGSKDQLLPLFGCDRRFSIAGGGLCPEHCLSVSP